MRNVDQRARPAYALSSVDNALRLLQMLRDAGEVRLTDVAEALGISPSAAHRLLQMLVYRGFAIQDDSRHYLAGPGLGAQVPERSSAARLRRIAEPYLDLLTLQTGETSHLMIRVGTTVRFLATSEAGGSIVRIGDRRGAVLPALSTSGGKILLAHLADADLTRLLRSGAAELAGSWLPAPEFESTLATLKRFREVGHAVNYEESEDGVCAVGMAVPAAEPPVAAISITAPRQRQDVITRRATLTALRTVAQDIAAEIAPPADDEAPLSRP